MSCKGPLEPAAESAEVRATEQDEEEERYSVELILLTRLTLVVRIKIICSRVMQGERLSTPR